MKVDKINTEYKSSVTIKQHYEVDVAPFKEADKITVPLHPMNIANSKELVDIHSIQGKIVDTLKVDQSSQKIDGAFLKIIKNLVQGKSQLIIESINIKDDNSLDIFIKDGNVISIKNMKAFITLQEAMELLKNNEIKQPINEVNIKFMNKSSSYILINGKSSAEELFYVNETTYRQVKDINPNVDDILNEFVAFDKQGKVIVIYVPMLGYLYLDNNLLKKITYHLPYLSSLHEYGIKYTIISMIKKYTWQMISILLLLLLVLLKL